MNDDKKCDECGGEEFTPRIEDAVDDTKLVCVNCGKIHTVKS